MYENAQQYSHLNPLYVPVIDSVINQATLYRVFYQFWLSRGMWMDLVSENGYLSEQNFSWECAGWAWCAFQETR